jgi:hypothetical protein
VLLKAAARAAGTKATERYIAHGLPCDYLVTERLSDALAKINNNRKRAMELSRQLNACSNCHCSSVLLEAQPLSSLSGEICVNESCTVESECTSHFTDVCILEQALIMSCLSVGVTDDANLLELIASDVGLDSAGDVLYAYCQVAKLAVHVDYNVANALLQQRD